MNESALPASLPVGVQLGVGVRGGSAYVTGQRNKAGQSQWADHFEESFIFDMSRLHISGKGQVLNQLRPTSVSYDDEFDDEEEVSERDICDEANEHWRDILVTRLDWKSLSPEIPENFQPLKEVQYESDMMYKVRPHLATSPRDFFSERVLTSLSNNVITRTEIAEQMRSRQGATFDPTLGDLFTIGSIQTSSDLRNGNDQNRLIAFCSGKTRSVLNLAVLRGSDDKDTVATLTDKNVGDLTAVDLNSTIKCIKFPVPSSLLGRSSDFIGALTENAFHVLKIDSIDSQTLEIFTSSADPLPFSEFSDFPLTDFSFNPWDLQQIGIIDTKGNFGVGRIPKSCRRGNKVRMLKDVSGSIFDPEELSNWKKIEWSSSHDRLLLMDRSKVIELNLSEDWQMQVIQAKTWSTIRDYRRLDDDFGILLTSAEIIVVRTSKEADHVARVISWKHDLDPRDPTIRFAFQKLQDDDEVSVITCIYSNLHNHIYIHGFIISGNGTLVRSTKDSSILEVPAAEKGFSDLCFVAPYIAKLQIADYDDGNKLKLIFLVRQVKGGTFLHYVLSDLSANIPGDNSLDIIQNSEGTDKIDMDFLSRKAHSTDFAKSIQTIVDNARARKPNHETPDDEIFQNYGYNLSKAINKFLDKSKGALSSDFQYLISDLVALPTNFGSIEELNSFLEQLFHYYREQDVSFTKLSTLSSMLLHEDVESLDIFRSKLLQCWEVVSPNSEFITLEVIKSLLRSVMRICRPSLYDDLAVKLANSLEDPYSTVLNSWDDEDVAEDPAPPSSQFSSQLPVISQSQIPTIKSSQQTSSSRLKRGRLNPQSGRISKSSTHSHSHLQVAEPPSSQALPSTLPNNMTPAFTLMQPISVSQSQSSQRSRKKKKRVGGFG